MSRLMVRSGKSNKYHPPFHPRLRIATESGWRPNQWDGQIFRPGVYGGLSGAAGDTSVEEAVKIYFEALKRCGHYQVEGFDGSAASTTPERGRG